MAIPARPARGRKTIKRGAGKRIVEGKSFRLADEVRYIQRRAADYDSRIVTIGQLILFSTKTGDAWLRRSRRASRSLCRTTSSPPDETDGSARMRVANMPGSFSVSRCRTKK